MSGLPTIGGLIRQLKNANLANIKLAGTTSGAMTLKAAAVAGTGTITLPAATDTVAVIGTAQSFTAEQTFTTMLATSLTTSGVNSQSVANALTAVGTDRATSLVLSKAINNVTAAASGVGATLPAGVVGQTITIFNNGTNAIKVYGNGSDTIDGTAAATGVTLTNAKRCAYVCAAANTILSAQLGATSA